MQKKILVLAVIILSGAVVQGQTTSDIKVYHQSKGGAQNITGRLRAIYAPRFRSNYPHPVVINWQTDILLPAGIAVSSGDDQNRMYILLAYKQRTSDLDVQTETKYQLIDPTERPNYTFAGAGCFQFRALYGTREELSNSAQKLAWVRNALRAV